MRYNFYIFYTKGSKMHLGDFSSHSNTDDLGDEFINESVVRYVATIMGDTYQMVCSKRN